MPTKKVAVIILHLKGFDDTHNCLCSLKQVMAPTFDVIFVDNGSTDGSGPKLLQAHNNVVYIHSPVNAGFAGGNNLGLAYALEKGYEFVLVLNNDTIVTPGFLQPLVNYLEHHPSTGMVQPCIFFDHDRQLLWNAGSFFNKLFGFTYTRGLNKRSTPELEHSCSVDWITGCAMLIRSSVLKQIGFFAPNMFLYYEDVDLSFRCRQKGFSLAYVPESILFHKAGASGKQKGKEGTILPQIHYYNLRNRIWILKQYTAWYCWPTVFLLNVSYAAGLIVYFLLRRRIQKFKAVSKAVLHGIVGNINYKQAETASSVPVNTLHRA